MSKHVSHDLKLQPSRDEWARQDFVSALRARVLNDMANTMKQHYEVAIAPKMEKPAETGQDVHKAMKPDLYFKFYSGLRVNAQEMVWDAVRPTLERDADRLQGVARELGEKAVGGSISLDPEFVVPSNVESIDVHLMPGSYHSESGLDDLRAGALYDNGLDVFSFGLMGQNLDDIGQSISTWVSQKFPNFKPERILDMGCSIGHNTQPWAQTYPDAHVTGMDVSAPCLRYAHARSQSQGVPVHYKQGNAAHTDLPSGSFDLVFSSMFLHELPKKDIRGVFAEAFRLLKPGGLLLHYELPPNSATSPYDGFYLDWDSFYNYEPYYKGFRDMDPLGLCTEAGFSKDQFFQTVVPSINWYGRDAVIESLAVDKAEAGDDNTGRFADGVKWFSFGAWKDTAA
ncbi:MAG: class I SAM-dependent methyltransferase [Pseudomonadota bacterium]